MHLTLPQMPYYMSRVQELCADVVPGEPLKHPITLRASFAKGAGLPQGDLARISADEPCHAVVLKLAARLLEVA